jgi:hypothetical protein
MERMCVLMKFECINQTETEREKWEGVIKKCEKHEGHFEIMIESRSSIMVLFGKTSRGGFACIPDFGVGCHLVDLRDKFWNTEKLVEVLGKADGITVATALYTLADFIKDN